MKRQIPKNVRQIGNVSDISKIYVEDYVDTYFNQLCDKSDSEMIGAFLIGEIVQEEGQDFIYVYGAIRMKEPTINEEVWKQGCETCKQFFGDAEILGWFVTGEDCPAEIDHGIAKIHQKYFSREKSLFVTKNARDKEEKFYMYKYRDMMECNGHYIYYEKNVEMQNYMISTRKKVGFTPSEIIEDRVTKNFRSIIREKSEKNNQKSHSKFIYATSTFLVLIIFVIGVNAMNNYEKMQEIKNNITENQVIEEEEELIETVGENITAETQEEPQEEPIIEIEQSEEVKPENDITTSKTYIVKKGDTLESISREEYGTVLQVKKICELNGLEDGNIIYIGQKLLLP